MSVSKETRKPESMATPCPRCGGKQLVTMYKGKPHEWRVWCQRCSLDKGKR